MAVAEAEGEKEAVCDATGKEYFVGTVVSIRPDRPKRGGLEDQMGVDIYTSLSNGFQLVQIICQLDNLPRVLWFPSKYFPPGMELFIHAQQTDPVLGYPQAGSAATGA